MAEITLPKLDDAVSRGKKIADSPALSLIFKGSMVIACGMIVYFSKGTYETVQLHSAALTTQNDDIANVQATVNKIDARSTADHDLVTVLRSQMDSVLVQIEKLWQQRSSTSGNKTP